MCLLVFVKEVLLAVKLPDWFLFQYISAYLASLVSLLNLWIQLISANIPAVYTIFISRIDSNSYTLGIVLTTCLISLSNSLICFVNVLISYAYMLNIWSTDSDTIIVLCNVVVSHNRFIVSPTISVISARVWACF